LLHHCSRMAHPHTPPCLHLLMDQPHVGIAALPSNMLSLIAQLVRQLISRGTPSTCLCK
jgi:hypothetical protein